MKPGAALEIVEEDLTFPGRPVDADEGSEFGSSSPTLGGCDSGGIPSPSSGYTRSFWKRNAGQAQELGALRGPSGLVGGGLARSSELNVPSSSSTPEIARTHEVPVFKPITQPSVHNVQRSRSLTHPSTEVEARSRGTPPTLKSRKRPSTAQSTPAQKLSHAPSPSQLGLAVAAAATATRLSFSRKRSKSKTERPWTASSAPDRCSPGLQTTSSPSSGSSGSSPPLSYSSRYHSAVSGSVPPTPPLSPPPKPRTDAMSQAILMEAGAPSYLITPYPGAKSPSAAAGHDKGDTSLAKIATNGSTNITANGAGVVADRKLENPRDHTVLETIYNEMHAVRFVNLTPLNLLGNALGLWFKGASQHENGDVCMLTVCCM